MITRLIILLLIFFGCTADSQDEVIRVTKNTSGVIENSNNSVNSDSDSNQQNESNNSSNSNDSNNQESINTQDDQNEIQTITSEQINFSFYEIQFLNENLGFAAAGSKLMKTNDGGDSWAEIYNSEHISEVLFLNELTGFINSDDKLLKTSNGGNSFEEIHDSNRSITDILMYDGTLIVSSASRLQPEKKSVFNFRVGVLI